MVATRPRPARADAYPEQTTYKVSACCVDPSLPSLECKLPVCVLDLRQGLRDLKSANLTGKIRRLLEQGMTVRGVAKELGVNRTTVQRAKRQLGRDS